MEEQLELNISTTIKKSKYSIIYFFILSILLKCIYFQFTTGLSNFPMLSKSNFIMITGTLSSLLLILAIILLITRKKLNGRIILWATLISILLLVDTNFFRYYRKLLSIPAFSSFDVKLLSNVNNSIFGLFKFTDIIYLIDLPFMIYFSRKLSKKNSYSFVMKKSIAYSMISALLALNLFLISFTSADINKEVDTSRYVTRNMGIFYGHYNDIKQFLSDEISNSILTQRDVQTVNTYVSNNGSGNNAYTGIAKNKNLIIVQVEALQEFVIGRKINGQEITPNMNALIKESAYFDNFYYQIEDGSTSDAEFLCNTSLYPLEAGSVYYRYPENTYPSLAKLVKSNGYKAYVSHAYSSIFWNRRQMYKNLMFDEFIDSSYYEMDDTLGWDGTALSDVSFFKQSFDKINTTDPFYNFLITLTTHYPFDTFRDYEFEDDPLDVGDYEGEFIGDYIKSAYYVDKAIGVLIKELKSRDLYDNSVIAIYGDHFAVPINKKTDLLEYLDIENTDTEWIKLQKVPFILRYPGVKQGEVIHTTAGQIDILPTVANLLGMKADYALGKDLLNTDKGYAVLRNGSIVTDEYYYFSDKKKVYNINNGEELNINNYKSEINDYQQQLDISDIIVIKNALK